MKDISIKPIDYFIVYILIGFSGVTFFYLNPLGLYSTIFIVLIFTLIKKKSFVFFDKILLAVFILLIISVLQFIFTSLFPIQTFLFVFKRVVLAYLVLNFVRHKFINVYVDVLFIMGFISLIIHMLSLFSSSILDFFINSIVPFIPFQPLDSFHFNYSIIIHDFWQIDFFRNSGPFWEPGANAGFSVLALAFNLFLLRDNIFSFKNLLFALIIVSTLSTTGYIALFAVLFFYLNKSNNIFFKLIFVSILGLSINFIVFNIDFIGDKLLLQYEEADSENARVSRFASALLDLETFKNYPVSGFPTFDARNGAADESEFRTNGIFILLAGWGIFGFLLYFIFVYFGFKKASVFFGFNSKSNNIALFLLFLICLIGFSENYFSRPIFIAFMLMFSYYSIPSINYFSNFEPLVSDKK